jgi:hypothetical protein
MTDPRPTQPSEPTDEEQSLQGYAPDLDDPRTALKAMEQAFDYRGDVTLTLRDGSSVSGYIFDRRTADRLEDSHVRLLPTDSDERRTVSYAEIARIEFSGKDAAHGKSFERWLQKYVEKKQRGEAANLYPDQLD